MVGSTIPREVHFLAKAILFRNRWFGWLIRTFNAIPLKRMAFDRSTLRKSMELLETGRSILLFPEGQRIFADELGKPMSGVGYLAVKSGIPVFPLYVAGSNNLRDCWLGKRRLVVKHGRPLRLTDPSVSDTASSDDFGHYSQTVMAAIQSLKDELEWEDRRKPL
jgi:1-acyl-sn-glycerol-3-phosphate acyltransferase